MARKRKAKKSTEKIKVDWSLMEKFCKAYDIPLEYEKGKFRFSEFLFKIHSAIAGELIPKALLCEREVGKVIGAEGEDSENFGGSPDGNSYVSLTMEEDPYTGLKLTAEEDEEDDEDEDEDEDELEKEDDEEDDEEEDDEDEDEEDEEDDEEEEDDDEEDEDEEDDDLEKDDDEEDEEDDDDEDEEEDDDDEDEEDNEDEAPLSKAVPKKRGRGRPPGSKSKKKSPAELEKKAKELEKRRKKLIAMIPKLKKNPKKLADIVYRDLLILSKYLGSKKPMALGPADAQRIWIAKKLKSKK